MDLTVLTRKHGIKIPPTFPVSVEECSLAVGEIVGHGSVVSAARMNNAVVIFFDTIRNTNRVLDSGLEVGGKFLPIYPLSTPAVRVTVSNVPPFIKDEDITRELSRYGKIVNKVRKVSSGCKSPLLKHVVSHRRQLRMIPKDRSKGLDLVFKVRVDEFDYVLYATTDDFKCFNCRKVGHQSRTCPEKNDYFFEDQNQEEKDTEEDRRDEQEGQEETGGIQKGKEKGSSVDEEVREEETTSGTQEVREEGTSKSQVVREEETTQEVREEGTSVSQEVREEETTQEVREEGTSETQKVRDSTGGQVETGCEVEMEGDEEKLKGPLLKRKQEGNGGRSHAKKATTKASGGAAEPEPGPKDDSESIMEEESESSQEEDSELSLEEDAADDGEPAGDRDGSCKSSEGYSVKKIQDYLRKSKGVRGAKVEDYLSDKEKLSSSARAHMKSKNRGGFTKTEGWRLVKIVQKVNKELNNDGSET